ncbi:hypothetical protein [Paucibacter sp. B51]|uniref:hypothetical protein n=1 Tax=Paucibacter sp. B51 TaxID=2993315 RepID=UPI0022EC0F07|nr:hypothetical protein [Paucibacter sp. B51]
MTLFSAFILRLARGLQLGLALCLALGLLVMGSAPAQAWGLIAAQQSATTCAPDLNAADGFTSWTEVTLEPAVDTPVTGAELGDGLEAPELGLPPSGLQLSATSLLPPDLKVPPLLDAPWLEGLQRPPRPRGG